MVGWLHIGALTAALLISTHPTVPAPVPESAPVLVWRMLPDERSAPIDPVLDEFVAVGRESAPAPDPDVFSDRDHGDPRTRRSVASESGEGDLPGSAGGTDPGGGQGHRPDDPAEVRGPDQVAATYQAPSGDIVDELRKALGWAPLPRSSSPGSSGDDRSGREPTSAAAKFADVNWVNATGTPLGVWCTEVQSILRDNWEGADLRVEERALGIQGDVVVAFRVDHGGKVSDVAIVRSSGIPELDLMAFHAVPDRLPRLPRSVREPSVAQRITFSYSNDFFRHEGEG